MRKSIEILDRLTGGTFDIWRIAGSKNAKNRALLMSTIMGTKIPQAKSGVNAIRSELFTRLDVQGNCLAAKENDFKTKCTKLI